jgi:hypothetical protein
LSSVALDDGRSSSDRGTANRHLDSPMA